MPKFVNPRNLPYAGAIVQAILFSIAGNEYFPAFGWLVGLGVGAVVNYSIALASSRISDIAKSRKPLAVVGLVAMLCLSPVTITLSLYYPASIYAGIAWALCVDVSIVLAGAIAGKSLLPAETPQKSAPAKQAKTKSARPSFVCRNAGAGCEKAFASQNAANAHGRTCKFKPTISMPIEITQEIKR